MSENPYQAPKAVQTPAPRQHELFVRLNKYQWRGFYIGLVMIIVTMIFHRAEDSLLNNVIGITGIIGSIILITSILSIIPLSIWGFAKGYREGRNHENKDHSPYNHS